MSVSGAKTADSGVAFEVSVNISGVEEVENAFRAKESAVRARVLAALMGLGQEVANAANARAPGQLAGTVTVRARDSSRNRNMIAAVVRSRSKLAYYVEFGHLGRERPVSGYSRKIMANRVWTVKSRSKRTDIRFGKMQVGAIPVRPYMRVFKNEKRPFLGPAYDAIRTRIEARLAEAVRGALGGS